jgi:hypothetical protein
MTKAITSASIVVAVLAVVSLGWADSLKVQPGMWKTVVTTTSADGKVQGPHTTTRCVTQNDLDDFGNKLTDINSAYQENCTRTSYTETSNTLDFAYQCTGRFPIDGGGSFKFDNPGHYTGSVTTKGTVMGMPFSNVARMEASRTGACTGKKPK